MSPVHSCSAMVGRHVMIESDSCDRCWCKENTHSRITCAVYCTLLCCTLLSSPRMIVAALTMARLPWGCCQQLMHAQSPRPNHHGSNPLQDGGQCYRQQSTQRGDWQTSVCGVTKAPSNIMNPHVDSAMVSSLHGCADKVGIFLNLLDASSGRCNLHEIK